MAEGQSMTTSEVVAKTSFTNTPAPRDQLHSPGGQGLDRLAALARLPQRQVAILDPLKLGL